jgi:hypothetical protein
MLWLVLDSQSVEGLKTHVVLVSIVLECLLSWMHSLAYVSAGHTGRHRSLDCPDTVPCSDCE